MKRFKERMLSENITKEQVWHYWDGDDQEALEIIQDKARQLESSTNCVVDVDTTEPRTFCVIRCIYSESATRDIILRQLRECTQEIMNALLGNTEHWE